MGYVRKCTEADKIRNETTRPGLVFGNTDVFCKFCNFLIGIRL